MKQYLTSLFPGEKSFSSLTRRITEASRILQLGLLDHIIIGAHQPRDEIAISALRKVASFPDAALLTFCSRPDPLTNRSEDFLEF